MEGERKGRKGERMEGESMRHGFWSMDALREIIKKLTFKLPMLDLL